jgi:hypothetical protein
MHRRHGLINVLVLAAVAWIAILVGIAQAAVSGSSRHPFNNDRTVVSGFGSQATKKSIFTQADSTTTSSITKANATSDAKITHANSTGTLWVQRTKDPGVLWIQTRDEDLRPLSTLKMSVSSSPPGDFQVEEMHAAQNTITKDLGVWVPIHGLYGIYKLPSGILWVLITKTEKIFEAPEIIIGEDNNNKKWWEIRRVQNLELVHLSRPDTLLSASNLKEEVRQLRLLRKSLKQHELYYCPTTSGENSNGRDLVVTDMTKTLQQSLEDVLDTNSASAKSWWESSNRRPDPRFFWNQASVEPILEKYQSYDPRSWERNTTGKLLQHVIPLTSAFVGVQSNVTVDSDIESESLAYTQLLISRRSRFRAGTRFTKRGADASGAVANYAETEQVCLVVDPSFKTLRHISSYVQTRGSIPLRWSSPTDIKTYRPRIRIGTDPLAQARALRLHLVEQQAYYALKDPMRSKSTAQIVFVNLIDKHSDQGRLGRAFDAVLNAVLEVHNDTLSAVTTLEQNNTIFNKESNVVACALGEVSAEHVWFDFHAEVKNGKWDRLSILLKKLKPSLIDHGYLFARAPTKTSGWSIKRRQNAVVRTNCKRFQEEYFLQLCLFGSQDYFLCNLFFINRHGLPR